MELCEGVSKSFVGGEDQHLKIMWKKGHNHRVEGEIDNGGKRSPTVGEPTRHAPHISTITRSNLGVWFLTAPNTPQCKMHSMDIRGGQIMFNFVY